MENVAVEAALDSLIGQFSSAYDCLRELVQNSIDAGSPEIEVWTEFVPGEQGGQGTIVLHVDDYGVGMDESIIDNELTRLFASSKEDDLTKVGKFGIGFVSIFALKPKAVLLHTGRGGSWWEVLFHEDRTFTKTRLDVPVEGTQIALYLEGSEDRYREVVRNSWQSLKFWCRYSDVPITFEDRSGIQFDDGVRQVNEEFGVHADLPTNLAKGETQISVGYSWKPYYGFYNRGLTLAVLEDPDEMPARFRHVAFEVKSPYLEHTLSRETVLRDANFNKAMGMVRQAVDEVLFPRLLDRLEELASTKDFDAPSQLEYERLLAFLAAEPVDLFLNAERRRIVRLVDGSAAELGDVARKAEGRGVVLWAQTPSVLTERLLARGYPVVWGRPRSGESGPVLTEVVQRFLARKGGLLRFFRHLVRRGRDQVRVALPEELFVPVEIVSDERDLVDLHRLVRRCLALEEDQFAMGRLMTPVAESPLVLVGEKIDELMPARWSVGADVEASKLRFVLNVDHPYVDNVLNVAQESRRLAAALVARAVSLTAGLGVSMEEILSRTYEEGKVK